MVIFFTFTDDKVKNICKASKHIDLKIKVPNSKEVFFPLWLLLYCFMFKKPKAVVFRYLNDKEGFCSSFLMFSSRVFSILICVLFRIRILWFLHNVDKETNVHYNFFSKTLRFILAKKSNKIYVMDELLLTKAKKELPFVSHKLDHLSFGVREGSYKGFYDNTNELVRLLKQIQVGDEGEKLIGFCPTNSGDKYLHIKYSIDLVEAAKKENIGLRIVLVGDLDNYMIKEGILEYIKKEKDITYINRYLNYNHYELQSFVDFYWRGLSDQSISYSLYEAATIRTPVLALNTGFVGEAVQHYMLGSVVDLGMENIADAFHKIKTWDTSNADRFLSTHSWEAVANKLKLSIS